MRDQTAGKIVSLGRKAENARKLILHLYRKPVLSGSTAPKLLGLTPRSVNALINDLERLDILKEITGFKRNRVYVFEEYLKLFRK